MDEYISIPHGLDKAMLEVEFGHEAVRFYLERIAQRRREGRIYRNTLKTIYLWAYKDRRTQQGFYTSYRGYSHGRRQRNYGGT